MNPLLLSKATFIIGEHENESVIFIRFPYNQEIIKYLKSSFNARWSNSKKSWFVKNKPSFRTLFEITKSPMIRKSEMSLNPNNQMAFSHFKETLQLKAYSQNTIRTYCAEFMNLLSLLKKYDVNTLSAEKLRSYMLYSTNVLKLSENTLHSRMNAIKFYFEQVLHKNKLFFADIPRPKKAKKLPKALNTKEISKLFLNIDNPKHLLILQLCYGMGLRVSEIVNLKIEHIDSFKMSVRIEAGKGKKDRFVNLPQSILKELRSYYKMYQPQSYLFEGQNGGQYSIRSAQAVFKQAMQKAGIHKTVGIHSLRHSYATHLLEYGTDISLIQKLLGHTDIKTTLIYTQISDKQISKVKSPLDSL